MPYETVMKVLQVLLLQTDNTIRLTNCKTIMNNNDTTKHVFYCPNKNRTKYKPKATKNINGKKDKTTFTLI